MLAEAAGSVATPQIRNVGTLAGNVCQRPWCWYSGTGFPATRTAAISASRSPARTSSTPSSAADPATSSIRPTRRRRWWRWTPPSASSVRRRRAPGAGRGLLRAAAAERGSARTSWPTTRCSRRSSMPAAKPGTRSRTHKVHRPRGVDARGRQRRRRARDGRRGLPAARVVLGGVAPIPWQLPEVEQMLAGQRDHRRRSRRRRRKPRSAARVPLSKNAYKIPMTKGVVRRTLLQVAQNA